MSARYEACPTCGRLLLTRAAVTAEVRELLDGLTESSGPIEIHAELLAEVQRVVDAGACSLCDESQIAEARS